MKHVVVQPLPAFDHKPSVNQIASLMDDLIKNKIDSVSWPQYDYLPAVEFSIACNEENIFLKYYVNEKCIRAANCTVNSAVWEDSCVEFFISLGDEKAYYNFEFNCAGTALVGYGESKTGRQLLPEQLVNSITTYAAINRSGSDDYIHWELTVAIPNSIFWFNNPVSLKGKTGRANFYKCGDLLPVPHFVCWNAISNPEPNFHLPEFFGRITFM